MAERIVDLINKKYLRRFSKVFQEVKTEKIVHLSYSEKTISSYISKITATQYTI